MRVRVRVRVRVQVKVKRAAEVERCLGIVEVDQVLRDVAAELVVRELDRSHRRRVLGARRAAGARWCTAHEEARRGETEPEHPRSTKMPSLREEKRGTPQVTPW